METKRRKELIEATAKTALLLSKELSVELAEVVAYLQQGNHMAAAGTFAGMEDNFEYLGRTLSAAAAYTRSS